LLVITAEPAKRLVLFADRRNFRLEKLAKLVSAEQIKVRSEVLLSGG